MDLNKKLSNIPISNFKLLLNFIELGSLRECALTNNIEYNQLKRKLLQLEEQLGSKIIGSKNGYLVPTKQAQDLYNIMPPTIQSYNI
jgi:hypothetical protein